MPFHITQGFEVRPFKAVKLPDGRKQIRRFISWKQNSSLPVEVDWAYGHVDVFSAPPTGWEGLLLTNAETDYSIANNGAGNDPVCILTFEQVSATNGTLTQVGGPEYVKLPDGRLRTIYNYIQFSAATWTSGTVGTSTAPGDATSFLMEEDDVEDGSIRRIKRTYETKGTIGQTDSTGEGGTSLVRTIVSVGTIPSTPSGYTLINERVDGPAGFPTYTYTFAKGDGLAAVLIGTRTDGLREVTHVALGTKSTPDGVPIRDDYREADGYTVYTVTCMQAADGDEDPATATQSFERYVPFTYPGRAKAWVETAGSKSFLDCFLGPPTSTTLQATVNVSYSTTATLGTISDYWSPTSWATLRASWIGAYGVAASRVQSFPGYRTVSATPVTLTGTGFSEAIFGFNIFNGEDGTITVTGGPSDPGGTTKTLSAEIEPAFTSVAGVKWFRKILVSCDIPAQDTLPV